MVECFFAQYKQFVMRLPRSPSVALLQSKSTISGFSRACKTKRDLGQPPKRRAEPMRRPSWVFKEGEHGRRNGKHVYVSEKVGNRDDYLSQREAFCEASLSWRETSPETRDRCRKKAMAENATTKILKLDSLQKINETKHDYPSVWGIAEGSEYPLSEKTMQEQFHKKAGVKSGSKSWTDSLGSRVLEDPLFPAVVEYERPIKVCLCRPSLGSFLHSPWASSRRRKPR
jgi:hypothetical protein